MLVLTGKSASGKDTIVNSLIEKYGFKKLITYTTRPMRKNEINGVTYHYISDKEFLNKVENGFFAEWKKYKTTQGIWYYGSAIEDYEKSDNNTVIILTPEGIREINHLNLNIDMKIGFIYSSISTIRDRLKNRGDNINEIDRRILKDKEDFINIIKLSDFTIFNNANANIEDVVKNTFFQYQYELKKRKAN